MRKEKSCSPEENTWPLVKTCCSCYRSNGNVQLQSVGFDVMPLWYSGFSTGFEFKHPFVSYGFRKSILHEWMSQVMTGKWKMYTLPLSNADLDWRGESPEWSHWSYLRGKFFWFTESLFNATVPFCLISSCLQVKITNKMGICNMWILKAPVLRTLWA